MLGKEKEGKVFRINNYYTDCIQFWNWNIAIDGGEQFKLVERVGVCNAEPLTFAKVEEKVQ